MHVRKHLGRAGIPSKKWCADFRSLDGRLARRALSEHRNIAERIALDVADALDHARSGIAVNPAALSPDARRVFLSLLGPDHPLLRAASQQHTPLGEHLAAYLQHLTAHGRTERYVEETKDRLEDVFATLQWRRLADIRPEPLQAHLVARKVKGNGPRTRNVVLGCVRGFTRWCTANPPAAPRLAADPLRAIQRANVAADVRQPKRALTLDEVRRLIKRTPQPRALGYKLMALTGLRPIEVGRLRRCDIDLASGRLTVWNGKARRQDEVDLPAELVEDFGAYFARRALSPTAPLRLLPRQLASAWKRDIKRAGIDHVVDDRHATPYSLRHSYAAWLHAAGHPLGLISRAMRHSSLSVTDHYLRDVLRVVADATVHVPRLDEGGEAAERTA